jgi:hypothetical protein
MTHLALRLTARAEARNTHNVFFTSNSEVRSNDSSCFMFNSEVRSKEYTQCHFFTSNSEVRSNDSSCFTSNSEVRSKEYIYIYIYIYAPPFREGPFELYQAYLESVQTLHKIEVWSTHQQPLHPC